MKRRVVYLDLIKIISAYLVIYTHTGNIGSKLYAFGEYSFKRNTIYMMLDVFRTINVPLFFMVSGALLLGKEDSYTQLFKKYILRYIFIILVYSYFYFVVYQCNNWYDIREFISGVWDGSIIGLFWFFYSYLGYLLMLPFIRKMVQNMSSEDFKYLLILGILFKGVLDVVGNLCLGVSIGIPCNLVTDSIFYPIMGYYISYIIPETNKKKQIVGGLFISICCIIASVSMTYWAMNREGIVNGTGEYTESFLFSFTVIPTIYVFYLLKSIGNKLNNNSWAGKVINCLGNCSLGVYVFGLYLQVKMIFVYKYMNLHFPDFPQMICFIYVGIVVAVAVLITYILKKMPIVNRVL